MSSNPLENRVLLPSWKFIAGAILVAAAATAVYFCDCFGSRGTEEFHPFFYHNRLSAIEREDRIFARDKYCLVLQGEHIYPDENNPVLNVTADDGEKITVTPHYWINQLPQADTKH